MKIADPLPQLLVGADRQSGPVACLRPEVQLNLQINLRIWVVIGAVGGRLTKR
ncbi:MAG: hypothetical protein K2Z80_07260 [Xanthobacteraceae bacterium]|nr:hypothetical protein [Xanthobacteraceae bacterium]